MFGKSAVDSAYVFHQSNELLLTCEGHAHPCDSIDVQPRDSCTSYDDTHRQGADPNRKRILCDDCAEEHYEHWSEMWDNYRMSQI